MPIVDVELVVADAPATAQPAAAALASALGRIFGTLPGRTWVRLRTLPANRYAENDAPLPADALPTFVTVLLAHPPEGEALQAQAQALTQAVAAWRECPAERVHVAYAPAAAGRQAFGGKLV